MKSKGSQIYLKQAKIIQDVMSIHYQKFNCRNIIRVTTILGGLVCFHPMVDVNTNTRKWIQII
jgi:hypothetical protein